MERLLTPGEAAKIIAVAPTTIKEWLRRGELSGVKVRNLWRIRMSDLEEFIQRGIQKNRVVDGTSRQERSGDGNRTG